MINSHSIFSDICPADYADVSVLARLIGKNMISRLELVTLQPNIIVDLGAGTGEDASLLKQYYPDAKVIEIDYEENMLRYGESRQTQRVAADALSLPLQDHSVDLIFANLLLPWCADWENLFREWRRVLRPEGLLMFSCLGPDTLREISHTSLHRKDMHEIGDALMHAKFSDPVMDTEYLTFTYRDYKKCLYELRVTGMVNEISMPIGEEKINVTYEIIYGHAFGPEVTAEHSADDDGIVRIPLSHLRRQFSS